MRKTVKRLVATMLAAVTVATPARSWAEPVDPDGTCESYRQIASNATGGDYVGGRLEYETTGAVTRTTSPGTTTTTTTTSTISPPGGGPSVQATTTTTSTTAPETVTTQEPVGFYRMVDGTEYEINCVTGTSRKV